MHRTSLNGFVVVARLVWVAALITLAGCTSLLGDFTMADQDAGTDAMSSVGVACKADAFRCSDAWLYVCSSDGKGWTLNDTCGSSNLCDSTRGKCQKCSDGDYRCNDAQLEACTTGAWGSSRPACANANECNVAAMSCMTCAEGEHQCSGQDQKNLQECRGGVWQSLDTCASSSLCKDSLEAASAPSWSKKCSAPGCSPAGGYRCDEKQGTSLLRCLPDQSGWAAVDTCQSAALCAASAADAAGTEKRGDKCLAPSCSPANSFMCAGETTVQQCNADLTALVTTQTCTPPLVCNAAQGTCTGPCTAGDWGCNGAILQKCTDTQMWQTVETCQSTALCTPVKNQSTGVWSGTKCAAPVCKAGSFRCSANSAGTASTDGGVRADASTSEAGAASVAPLAVGLEKCNAELTDWVSIATCDSRALCDDTGGRCIPRKCPSAGALQCSGTTLQQCSADFSTWNNVKTCATGETCNTNLAQPCIAHCPAVSVRCNGKVSQKCADTATGPVWSTASTCATEELCTCGLSTPNKCPLGLATDNVCGKVVCGGSQANRRCTGTVLEQCKAGRDGWETLKDCKAANLCIAGTAPTYADGYCATCPTAGEVRCNATSTPATLQTCSSDRLSWSTQTCPSSCVDSGNADYCGNCAPGELRCGGTAAAPEVDVCAADQKSLTRSALCPNGCIDQGTTDYCAVCALGEQRCTGAAAGSRLQACSADRKTLSAGTVCSNGCTDSGTADFCDVCVRGKVECTTGGIRTCMGDRWVTTTTCPPGLACIAPATGAPYCAACTEGSKQCGTGVVQTCTNGSWVTTTTCATGVMCTTPPAPAVPACAVCAENASRCSSDGSETQTCVGGQWASATPKNACPMGCFAGSPAYCAVCTEGGKRCNPDAPEIQVCASGKWASTAPKSSCATAPGCVAAAAPYCAECTTEGAKQCGPVVSQLQTCSSNKWVTSSCGANVVCTGTAPAATCATCTEGTRCNATTGNLETCSGGALTVKNCGGNGCGGVPLDCMTPPPPECSGSDRRCAGTGTPPPQIQACSSTGTWAPATLCANGCVVENGKTDHCLTCIPNTCTGMQFCDVNGTLQTCANGCGATDGGPDGCL